MIGIVLVAASPALTLFDSGASHCFMSQKFVTKHTIPVESLTTGWNINTGSGVLQTSSACRICPVGIWWARIVC